MYLRLMTSDKVAMRTCHQQGSSVIMRGDVKSAGNGGEEELDVTLLSLRTLDRT